MHSTHELLYKDRVITHKLLLLSRYFYIKEYADKLLHLNVIIRHMEENDFLEMKVYMPVEIFKEQFVFCKKRGHEVCRHQNEFCPPYCHEVHFRTTKKVKCKVFEEIDVKTDQEFTLKYKDELFENEFDPKLLYWI